MSKREHIGTLILGPGVNALLVWEAALQQLLPLCHVLYCFAALSVARQQLPLFHYLQFSFFTLAIQQIFL
jgi:predicted exporter